jgi:hypothetical protein
VGCSSINTIKNFHSESEFYNDLNRSVSDQEVKVKTKKDSTIYLNGGFQINNDTLILTNEKIKEAKLISLRELREIDYTNFQSSSAFLELKNGEKFLAEDIQISNGEMRFNNIKYRDVKSSLSISEIKEISYDNRWKSAINGLLIGTLSGVITGAFTHIIPATERHPSFNPPYQKSEYNRLTSLVIGTLTGAIIGTITGWLIGYNIIYRF